MDETTIDLREIIQIIKKRRVYIAKICILFTLVALIASFIIPPTYQGEVLLRVKQPQGLADSLLASLPMDNPLATRQLMMTYAEILTSRTVVQELIDTTQSAKNKSDIPTYEDMLKRIRTQEVKDTEILKVDVLAPSPEEAKRVANTLTQIFLNRITMLVRSEQKIVREFIGQRLNDSKKELSQAEDSLEEYKQREKIYEPQEEGKALIDKLAAIDKLSADNRVSLAASGANLASVNQQLGEEKAGFVADNPLIQQYKAKLAELEVERVGLLQEYTEKNPRVLAVQAGIDDTKSRLNDEVAKVISAEAPSMNPIHLGLLQAKMQSEAEIGAFTAQKQAIDKILAENQGIVEQLPAKQKGLVKVMRNANVAQEIYIMLAKRYEEARISEVQEPTDVQVVDAAVTPEKPVTPRKVLNTVVGFVLGLFFGIGRAFLKEYLNRSICTAKDVQLFLNLPVLGSIPDFNRDAAPRRKKGMFNWLKGILARKKQLARQAGKEVSP
ncbi:lipopolysaccharide biosynthesis [Lucifera butyrica]|uniref:Lipopolysaccharide biosynthesis n=1 Tax=Lucifera butyrica TaxID=1351585 RepID=A0A498REN6_9FIRM|nr:GumC family protein [Lucifera butyrica]VBB09397.1 lipopolysaccharide biosynthesis [Lucifera butyrica]